MSSYPAVYSPYDEDDDEQQQSQYPPVAPPSASVAATPAGDPNAPFPAVTPPSISPAQGRMNDMLAKGPPEVHPLHGFKKGIDILGQIFAPNVENVLRYGPQNAYKRQMATAQQDVQNENENLNAPIERQQKQALASQESARAEATLHPPVKPKEEQWEVLPNMLGKNGELVQQEKNSGQVRLVPNISGVGPMKPPAEDALDKQYADAIASGDHEAANRILKVKHDLAVASQPPQQPQRPQQQLVVGGDGTIIEAKPGMKLPTGAKTLSGDLAGNKPSADEQKRADMVENLNENLDQLEDIVNRRPELFGPVAGRMTKAKEWLGTDDKDVAALKGIEDRLGMVQQSAHSMRSAQHVAASADSILNGFKNGADALKRAISDARKSGQTFTKDAQRGAPQAQPQGGGMIRARDPQGQLHEAPAGTPLPAGWKQE